MMLKAISILIIFSAIASIRLILFLQSSEEFLLEASSHFQDLVACSDTHPAEICWNEYGQGLLKLARPSLSDLAFQLVTVCLQQVESQHPHDLSFMLGIQKCFHAADFVDFRLGCCLAKPHVPKSGPTEPWLTFVAFLLVTLLIFVFPIDTHEKVWEILVLGTNIFICICRISTSWTKTWIVMLLEKRKASCTAKRHESTIYTLTLPPFSQATILGAKWHDTKLAPNAVSKETCKHQVDMSGAIENIDKESHEGPKKSSNLFLVNDIPTSNARKAGDTNNCNTCARRCKENASIAINNNNNAQKSVLAIPNALAAEKQDIIVGERPKFIGSHHCQDVSSEPRQVSSADEVEFLVSLPPPSPKALGIHSLDVLSIMVEEDTLPVDYSNDKPSFNILTEIGRAKMRAYIITKMRHKTSHISGETLDDMSLHSSN